MKKLLLILVLAFISNNAMAEWVQYVDNDETTFYYMPNSIRMSDGKAKVWTLYDYKSAQTLHIPSLGTRRYLSVKIQEQIDCQEEQLKELYSALYSENMGKGDVVESANISSMTDWNPVMPETAGQALWVIVCSGVGSKELEGLKKGMEGLTKGMEKLEAKENKTLEDVINMVKEFNKVIEDNPKYMEVMTKLYPEFSQQWLQIKELNKILEDNPKFFEEARKEKIN